MSDLSLTKFIMKYGEPYSKVLGIDLAKGDSGEILKWFLASILYGKPIRESSATRTYRCFERRGVLTLDKILEMEWEGLVNILDEGGYVRYDFSTADRLLEVFGKLKEEYSGDLNLLYKRAVNSRDIEERLMSLGKGIGPTTISIFLRDMREVWPKADPTPTPLVREAMDKLGIADLKGFAHRRKLNIIRLETALFRASKEFLKKGRKFSVKI